MTYPSFDDYNTNQILKKLKSANRRTFWVGAVGAGATVLSLIVAYLK